MAARHLSFPADNLTVASLDKVTVFNSLRATICTLANWNLSGAVRKITLRPPVSSDHRERKPPRNRDSGLAHDT